MITWTTYGTWMQGDKRRYVKDGKTYDADEKLEVMSRQLQKGNTARLTKRQRETVRKAFVEQAKKMTQQVYAIAVCSDHVHLVLDCVDEPIEDVVRLYKNAGYFALRKKGFKARVWTRGYDKRFCYDTASLRNRIDYVQRHNNHPPRCDLGNNHPPRCDLGAK